MSKSVDWSTFVHEAGHAAATEFCGGVSHQIVLKPNGAGWHSHSLATDGRFADDVARVIICMGPEIVGTLMSDGDKQTLWGYSLDVIREALNIVADEGVRAQITMRAAEIASNLQMGMNQPSRYMGDPDPFRMGQIYKQLRPCVEQRKLDRGERQRAHRERMERQYRRDVQNASRK